MKELAIMPRVTPITTKDQVSPEHRPVFDAVTEGRGSVRGPFSIMMYSPPQERVHTARRNHDIAGQTRATPDQEILSLGRAAKEFRVSDTTIKRLVTAGLLEIEQVAPWAPWEIRRADLESAPIRSVLLRRTGELLLSGTRRRPSRRSFNNHAHLRKAGIMSVSIDSRPTRSAGSP
jgi:hypothetical protein